MSEELNIEKKIREQFATLPQVIQDLINAKDWRTWVAQIVKKNSLNLDQATTLEHEVFMFLIGFLGVFDLRKSIEKELQVPTSKVNDIMIDINDMIVEPLKQRLINKTDESNDAWKNPAPKPEPTDRANVLAAIEDAGHASNVGVYVPEKGMYVKNEVEVKKINPVPQAVAPGEVVRPVPVEALFKAIPPKSIFEAKTSGVVSTPTARTFVPVTDGKPVQAPMSESSTVSSGGSDPYREPIN